MMNFLEAEALKIGQSEPGLGCTVITFQHQVVELDRNITDNIKYKRLLYILYLDINMIRCVLM